MIRTKQQPPLLLVPLEVRQYVYNYLIPPVQISHPLPSVGITSINRRPPTSVLLNIHPQLTDEILDHFYATTTWKLIFSHAFNFFRVDPELKHLERSPSLKQIRKVELVFYCDVLLLKEYPSFGLQSFCAEIQKRANRACDVLLGAEKLNVVIVTWIDTTSTGGWSEKAKVLEPLRKLNGRVQFRVGRVDGGDDVDRDRFVQAMRGVLGDGSGLETGLNGCDDEPGPSKLRMLAFDTRQDRQLYMEQGRIAGPVENEAVAGSVGWPSMAL